MLMKRLNRQKKRCIRMIVLNLIAICAVVCMGFLGRSMESTQAVRLMCTILLDCCLVFFVGAACKRIICGEY